VYPPATSEGVTTAPTGFDEIRRQELSRVFGLVVKARLFALPVLAAILGWIFVTDGALWRRALIAVALPALAAFFLFEMIRHRRRGAVSRSAVARNVVSATAAQLLLVVATGGIESPLLPLGVTLALVAGVFVSRGLAYALATGQIVALWALAAVAVLRLAPTLNPVPFGGGPRAGHTDALVWTTAATLTLMTALAQGAGRALRKAFDGMLRRALAAQDDALRAHAERAEELTGLAGEIATGLKSPLASVVGVAARLTPADARDAERLGVLRADAARMQRIVDEFLDFSRPIVPLALGRVDLGEIAREVVALHEGAAGERGVALEVRADGAEARCDPRKVRQILIHVVQEALDASRSGGAVVIEAEGGAAAARIRVLDRGTPLPARASGLGLTVARALARQHGGELALAPRQGGGCAAEVTLPGAPRP
jgi:signal transduction histidine kinase